jgi:predicted TIM-barrel fold metal-dependent hydrolase
LEVLDLIIDINMHALPDYLFKDEAVLESYLRIVPQAHGEFARLTTLPGTDRRQIVIEKPRGYENLNFCQNAVDTKARLEIMDKAGLDKAILRTPCWQEWLTLEMCRQVNDSMSDTAKLHPDRFLALATVPP